MNVCVCVCVYEYIHRYTSVVYTTLTTAVYILDTGIQAINVPYEAPYRV